MGDAERLEAIEAMIRAEYNTLPDSELHAFMASRLRAWIALEDAERSLVERLAPATIPSSSASRARSRCAARRSCREWRADLSMEEVEKLFTLIPSLVQQVPRAHREALTSTPRADAPARASKPWWRFW